MNPRILNVLTLLLPATFLFGGGSALARTAINLEDGLVFYYSFDSDRGREVTDVSGNGNHARIHSASYVSTGRIGRAVHFNGEGDYIELGDAPSMKTEVFTFTAWVKTDDMKGHWQSIISFEAMSYAISILPNGHVHYGWQAVKRGLEGTTDVRSGQWVFVAVTRDAENKANIYVNGCLENSITCDYYSKFQYSGKIGGEANGTEFFHGTIDEVRLYKRAFSEEEIRKLYRLITTNPPLMSEKGQGQPVGMRIDPDPNKDRVEIGGIVREEQGEALSDVHITLRPKSSEEFLTDSKGRFSGHYFMKHGPRSASHVYVFARHPGRDLAAALLLPEGEARQIDIELHEAVTIKGRICNRERQPIPESKITLVLCDNRWGQYIRRSDWFGLKNAISVENNGFFHVRTLPHDCFYELVLRGAGYGMKRIELGTWNKQQHTIDLGDVVLLRANQHLSGRVIDESGRPIPNAEVTADGPEQPSVDSVRTNTEGQFSIQGLCPGKVILQASIDDESQTLKLSGRLNAEVGGRPVTITVSEWFPQCCVQGSGPWSLQGQPLPPLPDLNLRLDSAKSKGRKTLLCFWRKDSQQSRHFIRKLIHMVPELENRGFYILALRVPSSEDEVVSKSLIDLHIPFFHGELTDSETCLKVWGFSAGWLPWVIITDENHIVTKEYFGLQILRHLQ